ncbi:MAG: hypothetical protein JXB49_26005 [Bacteroidales bacterium]|nr:hypothetical protein [Bacteroidales bacterium]
MKRMFLIMLAVAFSAVSFGQDISGKWELNESKSKLNEQFSFSPKSLEITQDDNTLVLVKTVEFQGQSTNITEKYTLDGKECNNPGFMDATKKSTVSISDDKKIIKISSTISMDNGSMNLEEVFSKNGDNFVFESKTSSSFGDTTETAVYNKL